MARTPTPWYWRARSGWYITKDGQHHHLGKHPNGASPPRKIKGRWNTPPQIEHAFYSLMAAPAEAANQFRDATKMVGPTVAEIFEKYLDSCKKQRALRTYEWYRDHIQGFINFKPDIARLPVAGLRPFHVIEWADSHGEAWGNSYRRGGIIAIQRPFNWAEELGYIEVSPIKRIKKPQPERRDNHVAPDVFVEMLTHYPEQDPFRDLLLFAWHSGCRPQEARHLEPRHVFLEKQLIFIPKEEAKGKRRPRIIHLHGPALDIITRLFNDRHHGKLFLNDDGVPWKRHAIAKRFERLAEKIGKRYAAYDLRHGFATRKLIQGNDPITVAELMGHRDGTMLAKVYQHLDKDHGHLRKALSD